jgi:hypothetical protein
MNKHVVAVLVLSLVVGLIGIAVAQAGMGGGQMPMGQSPKVGEDKPAEQPSQMPMNPEFAARMTVYFPQDRGSPAEPRRAGSRPLRAGLLGGQTTSACDPLPHPG